MKTPFLPGAEIGAGELLTFAQRGFDDAELPNGHAEIYLLKKSNAPTRRLLVCQGVLRCLSREGPLPALPR